MNIILIFLAISTMIVTIKRHGLFSFPAFGIIGLGIYSLPAFIGSRLLFFYSKSIDKYFVDTSNESTFCYIVIWFSVLVINTFINSYSDKREIGFFSNQRNSINLVYFYNAAFFIATVGYLYLALDGGVLFFLLPRDDQLLGAIPILWKWSALFLLLSAILLKDRRRAFIAVLFLLVIFLRGDRTILAISALAAVAVSQDRRKNFVMIFQAKYIFTFLILGLIIVFGKPIYQYFKGETLGIPNLFSTDMIRQAIFNFEPLGTITHLEIVISTSFTIPFDKFIISILANALIIPSAFGFDTNLYNVSFTENLPDFLTYGIAGNFWAHAWSVGGLAGIIIFSIIYSSSLIWLQRLFSRSRHSRKILYASLGGLIAVYAHRNGLDNLLSFVRQIIIMYCVCSVIAYLLANIKRRKTKIFRRDF